ncbi:hypothetical protein AC579_1721 [Pseudocercospora musae]|uniref:Cytochrome P450 n=1 Tax=Pseudocercospora musae TaxID=113226 RepID=A0A139ICC0_9PEZI|nr:hypothetical protein AC579_1721 [Pseudocercospora musae]
MPLFFLLAAPVLAVVEHLLLAALLSDAEGRLRKDELWVSEGKNNLMIAADTVGKGLVTDYPSDVPTHALQIPFKEGRLPEHTVLRSGFGRTNFYRMFDVYGKQNLFTFHSASDHGERKKLLANANSKSNVIRGHVAEMVSAKIQDYLRLLKAQENAGGPNEISTSLHYYSLDSITHFLGTKEADMVRKRFLKPLLPMQKPSTYTGIRAHALRAMHKYTAAAAADKADETAKNTIIGRLYQSNAKLSDLEIASECADHFLAGIDTTSDTLMFLIWALSRPENEAYGTPMVEAADRLPYLDAVIKETLRLYAPLPASELRCADVKTVIDGYTIPAGTTVLHRYEEVFPEPLKWNPDRWLDDPKHVSMMKKWWWAFLSGGRMCIGSNLALAEMALVPAIYRKYRTKVKSGEENASPGITSRFEVFGDETFAETKASPVLHGRV